MKLEKHKKSRHLIVLIGGMIVMLLIIFLIAIMSPGLGTIESLMINQMIFRFLGGLFIVIILIAFNQSSILMHQSIKSSFIVIIPALIIAINNFPWSAWIQGRTEYLEPTHTVFLFFLECLSVGFFEELIFRGLLLMILLQRLMKYRQGLLWSILISSLAFSLAHLLNVFLGVPIHQVLLQTGYTFLMGFMWAIVYLRTRNLWIVMVLHALYNFFGQVLFEFGSVHQRFDLFTIMITIFIAMSSMIYYLKVFQHIHKVSYVFDSRIH